MHTLALSPVCWIYHEKLITWTVKASRRVITLVHAVIWWLTFIDIYTVNKDIPMRTRIVYRQCDWLHSPHFRVYPHESVTVSKQRETLTGFHPQINEGGNVKITRLHSRWNKTLAKKLLLNNAVTASWQTNIPKKSQIYFRSITSMLKTTKLKFEKPVRLTAFQKLQSVLSIAIFFKFVRPSLPFLYLLHCRRFCLISQHRQKRLRGRLSYNMHLKIFWQDLSNFNWIMFGHFVQRMC